MKKYEQVVTYIKDKISSGYYAVGAKIPSEDELIESLGISRSPIRKALEKLTEEGLIYKIQGSGSYVRNKAIPEAVTIYAILNTENSYLESRIIMGMRQAINDSSFSNIHLILMKPGQNTMQQIEVLNMIPITGKGGVICVPMVDRIRTGSRLLAANFRRIEKEGYPVILLDRGLPDFSGSSIMTDHTAAAEKMMQFIASRGHRKITVFYSHKDISSVKDRLEGIRTAFLSFPGEEKSLHLINTDENPLTVEDVHSIKEKGDTICFCLECEIALSLYLLAYEAGISIPDDISLCSFDDHCFNNFKNDFLTSVHQSLENIGYYSVQMILNKIQKKTSGNIHLLVESDITIHTSVANIPIEE